MNARRRQDIPPGIGEPDIPYDRSGGMAQSGGISGIPDAVGGMKKMSLEFAEPQAQAPQIPQGAGVPPAGMQGGIPPAGMQAPGDPMQQQGGMPPQGDQSSMLAGMIPPEQPQGFDSSMLTDQDLMGMVDDPSEQAGQQMFDQSMQDPQIQQQLMLAARRNIGGF